MTSEGRVNKAITQPPSAKNFAQNKQKQGKTYLVQVEGLVSAAQLEQLAAGVHLKDGKTLPAVALLVGEADLPIELWPRHPPFASVKTCQRHG